MRRCQLFAVIGLAAAVAGCPDCPREIVNAIRGNYTVNGTAHRLEGQVIVTQCVADRENGAAAATPTPTPESPLPTPEAAPVPPNGALGPLALRKTADRERLVSPGLITYTLTWQNHGEETAEDIIICDTIVAPQSVRRVRAAGEVEQTALEGGGTLVMIKPPPLAPGAGGWAVIEVWVP